MMCGENKTIEVLVSNFIFSIHSHSLTMSVREGERKGKRGRRWRRRRRRMNERMGEKRTKRGIDDIKREIDKR